MDAKLYLKELKRLTNSCDIGCNNCRLYDKMARECQEHDESMSVDIVEQWAKDCPPETVLDVFKRHYPNFLRDNDNIAPHSICPDSLNPKYNKHCAESRIWSCVECWNQSSIIEPRKEPLISVDECHNCKYTDKYQSEHPCRICSNNYTNEFRVREVE